MSLSGLFCPPPPPRIPWVTGEKAAAQALGGSTCWLSFRARVDTAGLVDTTAQGAVG